MFKSIRFKYNKNLIQITFTEYYTEEQNILSKHTKPFIKNDCIRAIKQEIRFLFTTSTEHRTGGPNKTYLTKNKNKMNKNKHKQTQRKKKKHL